MEPVIFDRERRWRDRGLCNGADPGIFFPAPSDPAKEALAICAQCPVLEQCRRDTLGEPHGVWGGKTEHQRSEERKKLRRKVDRWPPERRRQWGQALHGLQDEGLHWEKIRIISGIGHILAQELIAEYLASRPASEGRVTDLPLPEAPPDFPEGKGKRDLWVFTSGQTFDAWCRGETPDGVWVLVQINLGPRETHKWVLRDHIRFHREDRLPFYLEYIGRPDRDEKEKAIA
ncbi:WhiB family transcriptional regulator [Streptomyces tsukubensis]|uniref:WhiB family transcriptional regulator n=1 Tax=Streptomyces tsukubensis TaxID=83656 RepID=UPI00344C3C8A